MKRKNRRGEGEQENLQSPADITFFRGHLFIDSIPRSGPLLRSSAPDPWNNVNMHMRYRLPGFYTVLDRDVEGASLGRSNGVR